MHVDIFSDPICPWCYIGKRRFERALALRPDLDITHRWRAFQLNPDMPPDGMERAAYLRAKFGGDAGAHDVYERIAEAGRTVDIPFAFERIRRTPNTLLAHRLLHLAQAPEIDCGDALYETLFNAYFVEGGDIGDPDILAALAARAGIDAEEAAAYLAGEHERDTVLAEDAQARRLGLGGVPCFILDGRYAVSGAQQPEILVQAFEQALQIHAPAAGSGGA